MPEHLTEQSNPVAATLACLADLGHVEINEATVVAAWREALYPELELRIGRRLSAGMTAAQLDEFQALLDAEDHDGRLAWLDAHAPNHREVFREELTHLVDEAVAWFAQNLTDNTIGCTR